MKIHELAQRTGLSAPTIRFYETKGLLDDRHVCRGTNNYRDYSEEAVDHLRMIKDAQAAGFTLAEFKALEEACNVEAGIPEFAVPFTQRKIEAITQQIADLERVRAYLATKLTEMLQASQ